MTREFMDVQLGRLVSLRGMPGDTDEYFAALRDIPDDVFSAGIAHALKTRAWFPVPAEIRVDCDAVKAHVRPPAPEPAPSYHDLERALIVEIRNPFDPDKPLRLKVLREWRHDCDTCRDTGWASRQCPDTHCGRRFEHGPHEFVEHCACIEWNPTIRRRKEAMTKYSQAPEKAA
jgi:hypothetical protein